MIKLPFSQREHLQIFLASLTDKTCVPPLNFKLERGLKNILYYQCDLENCMDQVLYFLFFGRHEYTLTESSGLVQFWSVYSYYGFM